MDQGKEAVLRQTFAAPPGSLICTKKTKQKE
jgi:hypothetical protein